VAGHAACFASPGPIYEPEGTAATTGAWRALHAAGFRAGELVHNASATTCPAPR
jgi:phenylacetate-CoA ligase